MNRCRKTRTLLISATRSRIFQRGLLGYIRKISSATFDSNGYDTLRPDPTLSFQEIRALSTMASQETVNTKEDEGVNPKYDVVIVGAGMAGLSAAYRILTQRPETKLLILESRDRVGGRIWSIPFDTKKFGLDGVLEGGRSIVLGASFIHGVLGNPLMGLAKKIGLPVKRTADPTNPTSAPRAFTSDGKQIPVEIAGKLAGRVFGTVFGWLPAVAQGDDGGKGVMADDVSLKDGVLMEGSPIYGGEEEETSNGEPAGAGGEHDANPEGLVKGDKDDELRIALSVARLFQGWTGAPLDYVSLKWWGFNQDTEGGDGILVRGYGEMVDWLKCEVERMGGVIRLEERLTSVELVEEEDDDDGSVLLTTRISSSQKRKYEAPYTLLTLPLGVLKHSPPEFTPPMSIRRQRAIERLGMGLLDKIVLVYEKTWWAGASPDAMINILLPSKDDPTRLLGPTGGLPPNSSVDDQKGYTQKGLKGSFPPRTPAYLEQNPQSAMVFDLHAQCGIPALCVFVPGEFGDIIELCGEKVTTEWATSIVGQWLGGLKNGGDRGGDIPKPVEVLRTAWRKDENAYGSYAYIPVGGFRDGVDAQASPAPAPVGGRNEPMEGSAEKDATAASPLDQLELSRTMWGRCFWAGEHTDYNQYASVHAAWTSGAREAEKILVCLNGVDI